MPKHHYETKTIFYDYVSPEWLKTTMRLSIRKATHGDGEKGKLEVEQL